MPDQPYIDLSDLEAYKIALRNLFLAKNELFFPNDSEEHAAVIFEVFLEMAKEKVQFVCNNLKASVFQRPKMTAALQEAFKRGITINVVTQVEPEHSDFLVLLQKYQEKGLATISSLENYTLDYNFATMDDVAFRLEPDNKLQKAVGSMYCPEIVKKLSGLFESILGQKNIHSIQA
jgi:hypothetical protein